MGSRRTLSYQMVVFLGNGKLAGGSTGRSYAQIGWVEYAHGVRDSFVQVRHADGSLFTRFMNDPAPVGSYPVYTVLYNNTVGYFTFFRDNFQFHNGTTYADFVPTYGTIAGEINSLANQMPGAYTTDWEGYFDSYIWVGGSWQSFSFPIATSINSNSSLFGQQAASFLQAYIWDWAC